MERCSEQLISSIALFPFVVVRESFNSCSPDWQATVKLRKTGKSFSVRSLEDDTSRRAGGLVLPEKKQSFYSRLGRLRPLVKGSDRLAQALVQRTLHILAVKRFPLLASRLRYQHLRFNNSKDVEQLVEWLRPMDVLELAFWLSSLYANLLSKKRRKYHALFFTPPELSARVIANLTAAGVDFTTARLIDPACGGAAFLAPIAGVVRKALREKGRSPKRILRHLETHLTGWDIDPVLCKFCKAFVWMMMYEEIEAARFIPQLQVKSGDALTMSRRNKGRFEVVVCNPPYRKVPTGELASLSKENRVISSGQPNLYAIFMAVAVRLTKRDGRIVLITPTSFLSGQYFAPLRKYLATEAQVCSIDLVEKRQGVFVYVEQETAVTTLRRRQQIEKRTDTLTGVFAIGSQRGAELVGSADVPKDGSLWVLPRAKSDVPLLQLFTNKKHTFESYGYETGTGLFVPHRDKRKTLARKGRRRRAFPLVWSTDISRSGELGFEKNSHKKRFVVMPEADDEVVIRVPSVALQRTTAKDDARRLVAVPIAERFVAKYGGYIGENHVVFLLKTDHAVCEIGVLAKILRSHVVDRLFRCMSGSVAVSTSELAELPLPDPQVVNAALERGENVELAIAAGYKEPVESAVDRAARQLSTEEALA